MDKTKLLVATPMYNASSECINRLVASIGRYCGVTWLIRDDGSDNFGNELLRNLCDQYNIKLRYYYGENLGLTYGRNFLCDQFVNNSEFSEFTHMVFIDSDDYFNPGWYETICYWIDKVNLMFPNEKSPYLCFKYWNNATVQDECSIYTKLNTRYKAHMYQCQYPNGGVDMLHVIPREYLKEVKEFDGNYYHVVKGEKWTPCMHNFLAYTDYPASFISDMVASIGGHEGNMSSSYYDNVVTKYAGGQIDEAIMYTDIYGSDSNNLGFDWTRVPAHRWRWLCKCLIRMIKNGTLVRSDKKWDNYESKLPESKRLI
jgi:hypothetical protein